MKATEFKEYRLTWSKTPAATALDIHDYSFS